MTTDEFRSIVDARCEVMLDVTRKTLEEDPDLRLCEWLRLIEATRKAVSRLAPEAADVFESTELPELRGILMERFGLSELPPGPVN
ncbi:MAG: hypothetical protein P8127_17565 [Acidobacteriota bacterium]